jgi:hypothetical protein
VLLIASSACGSSGKARPSSTTTSSSRTTTTTTSTSTTSTTSTTTAPAASPPIVTAPRGRIDVPDVPAYSATASSVTAADLGSSYHAGCPVGPGRLRRVQLSYWGFDAQPHTGTLVVDADAVNAIVGAFHRLYDERFPIRRMETVDQYGANDRASMAADNTSAFNCRFVAGTSRWSAHAYGQAIDINTVENPYVPQGGDVSPPAGAAFMDRSNVRPGMAFWGGELVDAFAAYGWQWGGRWSDPDYQHFSATGG